MKYLNPQPQAQGEPIQYCSFCEGQGWTTEPDPRNGDPCQVQCDHCLGTGAQIVTLQSHREAMRKLSQAGRDALVVQFDEFREAIAKKDAALANIKYHAEFSDGGDDPAVLRGRLKCILDEIAAITQANEAVGRKEGGA